MTKIQAKSQKITTKHVSLVNRFLEEKVITREQLEAAMSEQKQTQEPILDILIKRGFLTETLVNQKRAEDFGIEYIPSLNRIEWNQQALDMFEPDFLKKHKCIPIRLKDDNIFIALGNPADIIAQDAIREHVKEANKDTELKVYFVAANESNIIEAIGEHYENKQQSAIIDESIQAAINHSLKEIRTSDEDAVKQPIEQLVDRILILGASWKASDIHINPEESHVQIRYRMDSVLFPGPSIPKELQNSIISRVKIMGNMNISEKRAPQDGKVSFNKEGYHLDLRISVIPTKHGENIVIRILEKNKLFKLDMLGFEGNMGEQVRKVTEKSYGVFLVTGPTGAGKSTTLYSILQSMNAIERNIVTLEDPIEYQLPFIRQSQVNPAVDYTFSTGLRAFLRHDPDVILVGEIRDRETAAMTFHAGQTGHFVMTTLHTNTAIGAVARLLSMNLDLYLLSNILQGVLAQRLVRKVCEFCKEERMSNSIETRWLGESQPVPLKYGKGCDRCKQKGYSGRQGIFELLVPDDDIRDLISTGAQESGIKKACIEKNFPFFYDDARMKVIRGITDFEEIVRTLPEVASP